MVEPSKSFSAKWDAVLLEMPKATKLLLGTRVQIVESNKISPRHGFVQPPCLFAFRRRKMKTSILMTNTLMRKRLLNAGRLVATAIFCFPSVKHSIKGLKVPARQENRKTNVYSRHGIETCKCVQIVAGERL